MFTPTELMRLANALEIKYTIHMIILNQSKNLFYNKLVPQNKKINEEKIKAIATEYDLVTNSYVCLKVSKHEIFYLINFATVHIIWVGNLSTEIW